MAKTKVTDREDTCLADAKMIEGCLNKDEYKNRYVTEEIKRFRVQKNLSEDELAERSGYDHDYLKKYNKDLFETNDKGQKVATHMPVNVVFGIALSLELPQSDINRLLDSAGFAPLKSYRTWRGDNLILTSFEDIEAAFAENNKNEAEKLIEDLNKKFYDLGIKMPFKRQL